MAWENELDDEMKGNLRRIFFYGRYRKSLVVRLSLTHPPHDASLYLKAIIIQAMTQNTEMEKCL